MYTVYWYRYPHGMENEAMTANWRDFDSLEKAINFLNGRVKLIKSINWAGGHVEDENRNWLYEIDYEGNEEDNREKFDTTEPEIAEPEEFKSELDTYDKMHFIQPFENEFNGKFSPTEIFESEEECDNMEKILNLNNFLKALIKSVGLEKTKEVRYTVQGVNVFFEFNDNMYKCYTPQSKLYKLSGQRFNLITWKDLKKDAFEKSDDNSGSLYAGRPPP